jgi:hypothetical protein
MSLWDMFKSWFAENREQMLSVRIPDPQAVVELKAEETYFGLWLTHSFLKRKSVWLNEYYPAAHVSVRLDVAGETRTLSRLARPAAGMVGPGVWSNFMVTGLLPYNGGTVELEAGLTALKSSNLLGAAVGVVDDFSSLVVPPVSEALAVASKVANGVQALLDAGEGDVFLGTHQAYVGPGGGGENELRPGYLAVIGATEKELKPADLLVKDGTLRVGNEGQSRPLEGFDYLLFRIEVRHERDDWRFPRFEQLIRRAKESAGEQSALERYRDQVLAEIINCPDLTRPDRRRVSIAVRDEIEEAISLGAGAVAEAPRSLAEIVARHAVSLDDPITATDFSLRDLIEHRV